jgi:hypothetical protein
MLKRSITYTNFNDVEVTEDFYFNISKSEIAEMELGRIPGGSFGSYMQRIVDAKDISAMIVEFKNLLLLSYGRKSEDGRSFMKNDQIRAEFEASPAYDLMFIEFATDAEKAYQFIEGVLPKDVVADINRDDVKAKYVAATTATTPTTPSQES